MSTQEDDDREAAQRECDCWQNHGLRLASFGECTCDCHAPMLLKIGEISQPWAMRYFCIPCVDGEHSQCEGLSCECRRCAYDDN